MTIDRRTAMATGLAAGLMPHAALAQDAPSPDFDAVLDSVFIGKAPVGLAGAVMDRTGITWAGVRGRRRVDAPDAVTLRDRWHLGSNTKAMTAAVYARLVDRGGASWDAPLSHLFPGAAIHPAWEGTTLPDFLHHRAGLKDAEALGPVFLMTARADPRPLPEQRRALVEAALARPPGGAKGAFEYGNANYILAGAAIEAITGRSWEEVMQAELFTPLNLTSAGFGAPLTDLDGGSNAWGHRGRGAARTAMNPTGSGSDNPLALGPAGTVHMSLDDYARWLRVFLNDGDGWLTPDSIATLSRAASGPGTPYAMGWIAPPINGWARGLMLAHEGSNTMWHAAATVAPSRGGAVIALTNVTVEEGTAAELVQGLMRAMG